LFPKTAARAPLREVATRNRDRVIISNDRGRDAAHDRHGVELKYDWQRALRPIETVD
jgi:hypothetical protein